MFLKKQLLALFINCLYISGLYILFNDIQMFCPCSLDFESLSQMEEVDLEGSGKVKVDFSSDLEKCIVGNSISFFPKTMIQKSCLKKNDWRAYLKLYYTDSRGLFIQYLVRNWHCSHHWEIFHCIQEPHEPLNNNVVLFFSCLDFAMVVSFRCAKGNLVYHHLLLLPSHKANQQESL